MYENSYLKFKVNDFLYLLALLLYTSTLMFQYTYLYNDLSQQRCFLIYVLKYIRYFSYLIVLFKIFINNTTSLKRIFLGVLLMAVTLFVAIHGTDKAPIFYVLMIFGAKDVNFRKIVRLYQFLHVILLTYCFMSAVIFNIGAESVLNNNEVRYFIGFGWVNRAAYIWLALLVETIYLRGKKMLFIEYLFFISGAIGIYLYTHTDFAFIVTLFTCGFFFLKNKGLLGKSKMKKFKSIKLAQFAFASFAIGSIALHAFYNSANTMMYTVNRLINFRFSLGKAAIEKYGLGLLGNDTVWNGASTMLWGTNGSNLYEYVDCGYLQVTLDYGILMLVMVLVFYMLGINNAFKTNDRYAIYIVFIYGVLCIFEPRLVDFVFNPFILYGMATLKMTRNALIADDENIKLMCKGV